MNDPIITTGVADTWINSAKTSAYYGDASSLQLSSGLREVLVRPSLPNILGRTITSATLYARAATPLVAQTLTYGPVDGHWTQRQRWSNAPARLAGYNKTAAVGATAAGALVALPVTEHLQAVADGTIDYHGWRLSTNSSAAQQWLRSKESGDPAWELHVTLASDADEPTNLRPDGGGAVGTSEPILAWDSPDQAQFQVQVDTPALGVAPDEVAPDYASGWVTSPAPEHDLAAAVYTPPVGTAPTFWRVQVIDEDGNTSDWSPWAEFTVAALPSWIVDAPTGAVGDPAVTVMAHLSAGTLNWWEVWATGPDRSDVRWRSRVQTSATVDVRVPRTNRDGRRIFREGTGGWLRLRGQDTTERATAVGERTVVEAWVQVAFAPNGAIVAPTNLVVMQAADGDPRLTWHFEITDVPESFNFMVDGQTVAQVGADDLTLNAGRYTWRDGGQVPPMRQHTLSVAAVADNGASNPATHTATHDVRGVWIIPDANIEPILLSGTAVGGFTKADRRATYTPVVGVPVDITYDWEGFSGTFEGVVDSRQDTWEVLDRVEAVRTKKNRVARLVWGSQSILVRIRDIHSTPTDNITARNLEHVVRFSFVQLDD